MTEPSAAEAFVRAHTLPGHAPLVPEIALWLASEITPIWQATEDWLAARNVAPPFWAFAWPGGQALARRVLDDPSLVAGRRVLDFAAGCGVAAIACARGGAASVEAAEIDPLAAAAIRLNAEANGCRLAIVRRDVLDEEPPDAGVVIAADCWYEGRLAERVLPWLRRVRARGIDVLVGDPNRDYLPADALVELASYEVRTTSDLDDMAKRRGWVYALRPDAGEPGALL